jgi:acyl-CoA thioesterase I
MSFVIKKILFFLMLCVVTLPAIAKNTILVIGDSLSAAHGIRVEDGWVELLKQRLHDNHYHYQVENLSVSGDTTSNGLANLPAALQKYHPVVTIIELGGNDGLRGLTLSVIQKNLQEMIRLTKNAGSKVLLLGVRLPTNYGPVYTEKFQQIFTDLSKENHISLVPDMLKNIDDKDALFQPDGIHPVAAAEPVILDNIWPALKAQL